jgi:hypothetical protein
MNDKDLLVENVLSAKPSSDKTVQDRLAALRNDKINKPVIYIGTGTCGMVAGAQETLDAIRKYLEEKRIETRIIEVGCIGLCSYEPIVDVQLPGRIASPSVILLQERWSRCWMMSSTGLYLVRM